jgi:DNA-binding response OmpR family regulator
MSWFLREEGYEVTVAKTNDDVAGIVRQRQPQVIVFNTQLADDTKRSWIADWRGLAPGARVINIIDGAPQSAPDVGADRTLDMPLYVDTLMDSVRELTGRSE